MEINTILTTIGLSSLITLSLTKGYEFWREKAKNKNEDRKLLRSALTNLTILWQNLLGFDFKDHLEISQDILIEQFKMLGANSNNLNELSIDEADKSVLITRQVESATEKMKILDAQISSVAEKLSGIKPLMASEIHDLQSSIAFQSIEKTLKDQLADGKERNEYSFEMIGNFQNEIFRSFKEKTLERIKPFILEIAKEIDKKTLEETKKHLEDREKERQDLLERKDPDKMNEVAKKMMEIMLTSHLKSLGNNVPDELKQLVAQDSNSNEENPQG